MNVFTNTKDGQVLASLMYTIKPNSYTVNYFSKSRIPVRY